MLSQFISVGPFALNLYTALIAAAVLATSAWAWRHTRDGRVIMGVCVVALFALAFGRIGYVALHWEYFREHTHELFSSAGLSEHGAVGGGTIGLILALRVVRCMSPAFVRQWLPLALSLVGIAASIGCIPNGCAYGREVFWQTDGESSPAWLLRADWPDAYSIHNPRWPTQALMASWLAATGASWAVWTGLRANRRGCRSVSPAISFAILCFAAGDFLIQFLRGDPAPMLAGLRIYQWLDLGGLASAAMIQRLP
ncbi:prolipoprotein diacylglyceryl transferase family protein [Candidatus Roseilinea sp. NK_OTU-006]|jgi:prolipoprotein diacylglyceryltransferase|nr:prolipoprotein diacylglyceryl transferase family protein [Candidatus Roseilinea sp. NK_OTU-006]